MLNILIIQYLNPNLFIKYINIFFLTLFIEHIYIMENIAPVFPKNLSYNIKMLQGHSKTCVKLTPDRNAVKSGESFRCKLPANTLIDLRSLVLYAKGTATKLAGASNVHFPRNTSSLIKTLSIYFNGSLIERIDNYNILKNRLDDLSCGGDQISKRALEIADPSVGYSVATDHTNATPKILTDSDAPDDTNRKLVINSWCGFLQSSNIEVIDSNDIGVIEIECELANDNILWSSGAGTANTDVSNAGATWKLDDIHFTINKIVFNDPLYYNMKAAKLLSSGLQIAYKTYVSSKGSSVEKGNVSVNATINTTSLDKLICCYTPSTTPIQPLLLYGSNNTTKGYSFSQVLSGYRKESLGSGTNGAIVAGDILTLPDIDGQTQAEEWRNSAGDAFNQSLFFKSNASGLGTSSIEINNTPLMPQPLEDYEVFNETLIAMGHKNYDKSSGCHAGMRSLSDFLKYYFTHIVSLENLSGTNDFYKSGLDGKSSALNIVWKQFYPTTGGFVIPYIFAETTRIVQVNEGNSIVVIV
jgi:hypothetical protein